MSCNIRTSRANDGDNNWEHRQDVALKVLQAQDPDVVCFQEMTDRQYYTLGAALSGFSSVRATDEPVGGDPVNTIFLRSSLFRTVSVGSYWLSKTPHIPGSKSWRSACVRMVTWVRLRDVANGGEYRIVNTHFDHVSQKARVNQARIIVQDCRAYPDAYPQLLTGDLNCNYRNRAISLLRAGGFRDTYERVHGTFDPGPTYHGFRGPEFDSRDGKIDWILFKGKLSVADAQVVMDNVGGRYPSDHYFITADVFPAA